MRRLRGLVQLEPLRRERDHRRPVAALLECVRVCASGLRVRAGEYRAPAIAPALEFVGAADPESIEKRAAIQLECALVLFGVHKRTEITRINRDLLARDYLFVIDF